MLWVQPRLAFFFVAFEIYPREFYPRDALILMAHGYLLILMRSSEHLSISTTPFVSESYSYILLPISFNKKILIETTTKNGGNTRSITQKNLGEPWQDTKIKLYTKNLATFYWLNLSDLYICDLNSNNYYINKYLSHLLHFSF